MTEITQYIKNIIKSYCDIDQNGKIEKTKKYDEVSIFNNACESYNETTGDFFVLGKKYNAFNIDYTEPKDATAIKKNSVVPISSQSQNKKVKNFRKALGLPQYDSKEYITDKMYQKWSTRSNTNLDKSFYEKLYDIIKKLKCSIDEKDFDTDKYHSTIEQTMDEVIAIFEVEAGLNSRTKNGIYNGIFQLDEKSLKTIQQFSDKYKIDNVDKKISIEQFRELSGDKQLDYLVGHIAYALKSGNFSKDNNLTPEKLWAMIKMPNKWKNNETLITNKKNIIKSTLKNAK